MLTTASQEPSPTASEFRGGTERFGFRFAVAVAIFLRPFVEFLFHQRYEIFRIESLLVGTGLLVLCLGVARATRNRLSLFIVAVCSVSVLQAPFITLLVYPLLDGIPLRYVVVAGIVCNGLLALPMKRHFLAVLLVFCGTSFLFGLAERIIGAPRISERFPSPQVDRPVVEKGVRPARVIHLILDEYMGPAGFPRDWGMHLTPEAPRSSIRALEDYSRTLGSFKSASPSGFKVNRCRPPAGRNERRL